MSSEIVMPDPISTKADTNVLRCRAGTGVKVARKCAGVPQWCSVVSHMSEVCEVWQCCSNTTNAHFTHFGWLTQIGQLSRPLKGKWYQCRGWAVVQQVPANNAGGNRVKPQLTL